MVRRITARFSLYAAGFTVIAIACFSLAGCGRGPEKKKQGEQDAIPVRVMRVERQTIQNTLDYVGDIKADNEAVVYPKVNGKIIEKIRNEGDPVLKGDTIAFIDRDEVGFTFEKAPVHTPVTGIIGRIYVDIGTQVTPQTPVAFVVQMDTVKISLDIPGQYLPKISVGQEALVSVQAYAGETFAGTVSRISPVLDLDTRTAPIEITIPNAAHALKSGMFARVELVIGTRESVPVIVKEALMGKGDGLYVYVVDGNRAYPRAVKVGINRGIMYEVTEGLQQGDLVVVMGQQRLYEGAVVAPEIEHEG